MARMRASPGLMTKLSTFAALAVGASGNVTGSATQEKQRNVKFRGRGKWMWLDNIVKLSAQRRRARQTHRGKRGKRTHLS